MFQQTELQEVTTQEDFVPCIFNLGQICSFEVELGAMTIRMVIPLTKANLLNVIPWEQEYSTDT